MSSFINFFLLFIFTTTIKAQERNFPFIRGIVIAAVSCNALAKTGKCLYGLQVERWFLGLIPFVHSGIKCFS